MADARWSIRLTESESSLFALETAVSLRGRIASSLRDPLGLQPWDDSPPLQEMEGTSVFPGAAVIHAWSPEISLDPSVHNICLFTGGRRDLSAEVVDTLARYDEVWSPFSLTSSVLREAGVPVRDVVLPTHEWEHKDISTTLSHPVVFCHEEWRGDGRGIQALVRAWLTSEAADSGNLLVHAPDVDATVVRDAVAALRSEFGVPTESRRVRIINVTSPSRLESCLAVSDIIVCCHIDEAGWRWSAGKAIAAGKPLVCTHVGEVLNQVAECHWVEASRDGNLLAAGLRQGIESTPIIARGHRWMSEWSLGDFCEGRLAKFTTKE